MKNLYESIKNNEKLYEGISSGFEDLDNKILGYLKGELIAIASRPKFGKTAFALLSVANAIKNKKSVQYFIANESIMMIKIKLISIINRIAIRDLLQGKINDEKILEEIKKTINLIDEYLVIEKELFFEIDDICTDIEFNQKEFDLLVVDSLEYINNNSSNKTSIVKRLKEVAYNIQTPILLLVNVEISASKRYFSKPVISDLNNADFIDEYADTILVINNPDFYKQRSEEIKEQKSKDRFDNPPYKSTYINKPIIEMQIDVIKNKNGFYSTIYIDFIKVCGRFLKKEIHMIDIDIPDIL